MENAVVKSLILVPSHFIAGSEDAPKSVMVASHSSSAVLSHPGRRFLLLLCKCKCQPIMPLMRNTRKVSFADLLGGYAVGQKSLQKLLLPLDIPQLGFTNIGACLHVNLRAPVCGFPIVSTPD